MEKGQVVGQKSMIVQLSEEVSKAFPELEGRSIAVSEINPFNQSTDIPNLPLSTSALVSEKAEHTRNGGGTIEITSEVMVHFFLKPEFIKGTPFYSFYDYEPIRDRMLALSHSWRSPLGGGISYQGLEVEIDTYAVCIGMIFEVVEKWCPPEQEPDLVIGPDTINVNLFRARDECCDLK